MRPHSSQQALTLETVSTVQRPVSSAHSQPTLNPRNSNASPSLYYSSGVPSPLSVNNNTDPIITFLRICRHGRTGGPLPHSQMAAPSHKCPSSGPFPQDTCTFPDFHPWFLPFRPGTISDRDSHTQSHPKRLIQSSHVGFGASHHTWIALKTGSLYSLSFSADAGY